MKLELKINKGKFLGYASILIQNSLVIDGIELHDGEKGRYIYMPLNPKMKKSRRNSSYPIDNKTREQILQLISEKYDETEEQKIIKEDTLNFVSSFKFNFKIKEDKVQQIILQELEELKKQTDFMINNKDILENKDIEKYLRDLEK